MTFQTARLKSNNHVTVLTMPEKLSHFVVYKCDIHGIVKQLKRTFIRTGNCSKCLGHSLTIQDYLAEFHYVHNGEYTYKLFNTSDTNITVICKIHGEFKQNKNYHRRGSKCPKCQHRSLTPAEKRENTSKLVNTNVDISITDFTKNYLEPNSAICRLHGSYKTTINSLNRGTGCKKCRYEKMGNSNALPINEVLNRFKETHADSFSYDVSTYSNTKSKMSITCRTCGLKFEQLVQSHANGAGCPSCSSDNAKRTKLERYGDENYNNPEKRRVTCNERYGVDNYTYLGKCCAYKKKEYALPSGNIILVQGYEHFLLDVLVQIYDESDIVTEWKHLPIFVYEFEWKEHRYFPDVYIKSTNTIYEVKSEYTLFSNVEVNHKKFNSVKHLGYNFKLVVYDNNGTVLNINESKQQNTEFLERARDYFDEQGFSHGVFFGNCDYLYHGIGQESLITKHDIENY